MVQPPSVQSSKPRFVWIPMSLTLKALGRCIRHKDDYGAVLLIDGRYGQKDKTQKLSKWVRTCVKSYPTVEDSLKVMEEFFSSAAAEYGK